MFSSQFLSTIADCVMGTLVTQFMNKICPKPAAPWHLLGPHPPTRAHEEHLNDHGLPVTSANEVIASVCRKNAFHEDTSGPPHPCAANTATNEVMHQLVTSPLAP